MPDSSSLTQLPEWIAFTKAASAVTIDVNALRVINAADIDIDISGQGSSPGLAAAAEALLLARDFPQMRERLLAGGIANVTEERAAWHSALRAPAPTEEIAAERQRLNAFVRSEERRVGKGGGGRGARERS